MVFRVLPWEKDVARLYPTYSPGDPSPIRSDFGLHPPSYRKISLTSPSKTVYTSLHSLPDNYLLMSLITLYIFIVKYTMNHFVYYIHLFTCLLFF